MGRWFRSVDFLPQYFFSLLCLFHVAIREKRRVDQRGNENRERTQRQLSDLNRYYVLVFLFFYSNRFSGPEDDQEQSIARSGVNQERQRKQHHGGRRSRDVARMVDNGARTGRAGRTGHAARGPRTTLHAPPHVRQCRPMFRKVRFPPFFVLF